MLTGFKANNKLTSLCLADKKGLDGPSKRKYVTKLIYIFLLGHDVDFGHLEAVNLLSSFKLYEKQAVCVD